MSRQLVMVAVGLVAAIGLTACPTDDPPERNCNEDGVCVDTGNGDEGCDKHSDCGVGEQCISGTCRAAAGCEKDEECPGSEVCKGGSCYKPQPEDTGMMDVGDTGATDASDGGDTGTTDVGPDGTTDADATDGGNGDGGSCNGCMLRNDAGMDQCVEGTDREACGSGGEQCKTCGEFEECENGECREKPCSPNNCRDGCCKDGQCKDGTAKMACGTDGETCSTCQGDTRCSASQQCESCNGCWTDSDECKKGESSDFCGTDGAACKSCGSDEKCEGGKCIEKSCSETCSGCCDGSQCLTGTRDGACGTGGESCKQCGDGYECDFTQSCDLDRDSRWDVVAIDGEVPKKNENGAYYDGRNNPPDPYIKVKVEGFSETKEGKSDKVDDDTTPFWYDTTASDVRAADLKRNDKTTFTVMDQDPWYRGGDDQIAQCVGNFKDAHFSGTVEWKCVNHKNSNNPVEVKYKFKVEYHP